LGPEQSAEGRGAGGILSDEGENLRGGRKGGRRAKRAASNGKVPEQKGRGHDEMRKGDGEGGRGANVLFKVSGA